jgi:DNA-binding transcriptional ArsR family regulator
MSGPRLSIIPAGAVTDRSLEPRDLQVLCLLGRHIDKAGWCVRSQVKMAGELDCGRSSVQRSLERLAEAGWIERKRRDGGNDGEQQSAAYAYRVRLDIDDAASIESTAIEEENSLADRAPSDEEQVPASHDEAANQADLSTGVPTDGQGCPAMEGHGCPPIAGHITSLSKREGERDARARDRLARGLVDFEARWPSAAADDRQRTAYAWAELSDDEREDALKGIAAFLDNLKRHGRDKVPAGWRYLEQRRWTLLEKPTTEPESFAPLAADSDDAKAVELIYALAGKTAAIEKYLRRGNQLYYRGEVTPQLRALAQAPGREQWVTLAHRQAGAWNSVIDKFVNADLRSHLREGDRAPWPWPPRKDGSLSTAPPDSLMSADDLEFAENEKL